MHRHAKNTSEIPQLILRPDTKVIRADECHIVTAMAQSKPCCQLGDSCRLANAGRADHGNDPATLQNGIAGNRHMPGDERQRSLPGMFWVGLSSDRLRQLAAYVRPEAQLRQWAKNSSPNRRPLPRLLPFEQRQLAFEQAAQGLDLLAHLADRRLLAPLYMRQRLASLWWCRLR